MPRRFKPTHTPAFIVIECRTAGATGRFFLRDHAYDRSIERNLEIQDIRLALSGVTTAEFQTDKGTWKVTGGADRDGEPVGMAVVFRGGILVITLF